MNSNALSPLGETVMLRVRAAHVLRAALSSSALALVLFAAALWGIGRAVFVARVFENMPSLVHVTAFGQFIVAAFLNTQFLVQVLSVLAAASLVWLMRDIGRTLKQLPRFA